MAPALGLGLGLGLGLVLVLGISRTVVKSRIFASGLDFQSKLSTHKWSDYWVISASIS